MSPETAFEAASRDLPFEELVRALRAGDEAAWGRVFDRLLPRATEAIRCEFGTTVARPENAGGEAVVSAYRTLYRRLKLGEFTLEGWEDLAALFVRIATNKCVDRLRKQQRLVREADLGGAPDGEAAGPALDRPAGGLSPLDEAIRAEALEEFRRVIDRVRRRLARKDVRARQIFNLRLQGAHTVAQIADVVGCSESSVKREWDEAVKLLKSLLKESLVDGLLG